MNMHIGFIYLWKDTKRNKFYIGSHKGSETDGYVGSNKRLKCAYKSRPSTFRRKILERVTFTEHAELIAIENKWLSMIKPEELFTKYYNEKKVATGGDIISTLPLERREEHKRKSIAARQAGFKKWQEENPELVSAQGKYARSCVKNHGYGVMFGEDNPFFGKHHSDETKKLLSEKLTGRLGTRTKTYKITFANGTEEIFEGYDSIYEKYCNDSHIKISRFVDTGTPISSNRVTSRNNLLQGALITTV